MLIGIALQTAEGETRVAVTPETAKKLKAQGHALRVQSGAGLQASAPDEAYVADCWANSCRPGTAAHGQITE